MKPTILIHEWVTGGGLVGQPLSDSWVTEGHAMRRAIARDFAAMTETPCRILVTLDARLPDDHGPWQLMRIDAANGERELEAAMSRADYALIIAPETGGILQNEAMYLEKAGIQSLGSTAAAIELTTDKDRFGRHLRDREIPTPIGYRIGSHEHQVESFAYPAILKPVDGAGAFETYLIDSHEALLERRRKSVGEYLFQEFVEGEPLSASYLVDREGGAYLLAVGRQRIEIEDGKITYRGGEIPYLGTVDMEPIEAAIASIPGLRGFIGVDFIADRRTGKSTVIEINPRATTSCVGLIALLPAGQLARAWLSACVGLPTHDSRLFERVAREIAERTPIEFEAGGTIRTRNGATYE